MGETWREDGKEEGHRASPPTTTVNFIAKDTSPQKKKLRLTSPARLIALRDRFIPAAGEALLV